MREDWLEIVWPKIPNVTNFHPSKDYEHSWQQLIVVTKDQLPEAIRGLNFLEIKKWKDIVKTIHPDECVEVPDMQVYQQNKEYFIQQGFTEAILRELFPILEQSIWSTFQLFMLARRFKTGGRIVEIGSGQGGSICTMGLAIDRNPAVELISIDKFQPYDEKTHAGWMFNVDRFSYKKFVYNLEIRNIKARNIFKWSFEAVGDIEDKSCDIVFIDGNHSYQSVKDDINWYLPKIKEGGIICGHDFHPRFPGVMIAVEEAFGNSFDVMDQSSIWIKL
jgi:precorrin-6B methylase 2